jgi:hypothetical protein
MLRVPPPGGTQFQFLCPSDWTPLESFQGKVFVKTWFGAGLASCSRADVLSSEVIRKLLLVTYRSLPRQLKMPKKAVEPPSYVAAMMAAMVPQARKTMHFTNAELDKLLLFLQACKPISN